MRHFHSVIGVPYMAFVLQPKSREKGFFSSHAERLTASWQLRLSLESYSSVSQNLLLFMRSVYRLCVRWSV